VPQRTFFINAGSAAYRSVGRSSLRTRAHEMSTNLLLTDIAARPRAFSWYGALSRERLAKWSAERGLSLPDDLVDLWCLYGGGEMFESEEILVPFDGPEYALDFDSENQRHHASGLPADLSVFHSGSWLSAVRALEPRYVTVDPERFSVEVTYPSLDAWYRQTVRLEFWERYGLSPEEP
jgi:hypothetical protein